MKKIIALLVIVSPVIIACSKGGGGGGGGGGGSTLNCATVTNKAFTADVNPIIQGTCAVSGCHNAGSVNGPGELLTYNQIFTARVSIRAAVNSGTMPKNSTLSTGQKNSILCWIDSGAPNN
jgi:hypothetical protein